MNNEPKQSDGDSTGSSEVDRKDLALDEALQLWGSERTAEPAHLEEQRTTAIELLASHRVAEQSAPAKNDSGKFSQGPRAQLLGLPSWAWAVAATLLLAVGLGWTINRSSDTQAIVESPSGSLDANVLTLVSTDLDQQRLLFSRFHEVFGNQIKSVADVDGELEVELREQNELPLEGGVAESEYISVRLVLISRDENSADEKWAVVHDMSMFAGQEHRIDIPMSGNGPEVSIWTFPVDDDLVSVDLEFEFKTPVEIGQANSQLEKTGEPKQLFATKRDGIEYRLYQTINRIQPDADAAGVGSLTNMVTAASKKEGYREDI